MQAHLHDFNYADLRPTPISAHTGLITSLRPAPVPTSPPVFVPSINAVDLILGRQIGRGGFGQVYEGRLKGTRVAVKRIPLRAANTSLGDEDDEDERAGNGANQIRVGSKEPAWLREVRVMETVRHPNIIFYYGTRVLEDQIDLIMEYAEGGSLRKLLVDQGQGLPLVDVVQLAQQIAAGLEYLYNLNPPIAHRDVKSDNILLVNRVAKLSDFGVAKWRVNDPQNGMAGVAVGTVNRASSATVGGTINFMAPECFGDLDDETVMPKHLGLKSDVYSFGMVIYEMLSARLPFDGLSHIHIINRVLQGYRPTLPASLPVQLNDLMRQTWLPIPERRPTFGEIIQILAMIPSNPDALSVINPNPVHGASAVPAFLLQTQQQPRRTPDIPNSITNTLIDSTDSSIYKSSTQLSSSQQPSSNQQSLTQQSSGRNPDDDALIHELEEANVLPHIISFFRDNKLTLDEFMQMEEREFIQDIPNIKKFDVRRLMGIQRKYGRSHSILSGSSTPSGGNMSLSNTQDESDSSMRLSDKHSRDSSLSKPWSHSLAQSTESLVEYKKGVSEYNEGNYHLGIEILEPLAQQGYESAQQFIQKKLESYQETFQIAISAYISHDFSKSLDYFQICLVLYPQFAAACVGVVMNIQQNPKLAPTSNDMTMEEDMVNMIRLAPDRSVETSIAYVNGLLERYKTRNPSYAAACAAILGGIHLYRANQELAYPLLEYAASNKNAFARCRVAEILRNPNSPRKNYAKAIELLHMASQDGSADADAQLGYCLYFGIGFPINLEDAYGYYLRAAEKRDPNGLHGVAMCYMAGKGVQVNVGKGIMYLLQGAELGHGKSQLKVAECYFRGTGMKKDYQEAAKWYLRISAHDCLKLAYKRLGEIHDQGLGVEKSPTQAFKYYQKAADLGCAFSQFKVAEAFIYGNIEPNCQDVGVRYLMEAVKQAEPNALHMAGVLSLQGAFMPTDKKKAFEYHLQAANLNLAASQVIVGDCYLEGRGVERDYIQAAEWYNRAAKQGDTLAASRLQQMKTGECRLL